MLAITSMKVFNPRELGQALRHARRAAGMTQIDLAERANVARSAVQKLEAGRGTVNLDTVLKLLRTLSLDLDVVSRSSAKQT
jgi:HTH-type transcriptional regulator / antitoxin HipB